MTSTYEQGQKLPKPCCLQYTSLTLNRMIYIIYSIIYSQYQLTTVIHSLPKPSVAFSPFHFPHLHLILHKNLPRFLTIW